jgi:hypothetical protein
VLCLGFVESIAVAAPTGTETQAIRAQVIAKVMIGLILPSTGKA